MPDDKRSRAQRRRNDRGNKPAFGAKGLSRQNLADAEDELGAAVTEQTASPGIIWTTLVDQWMAVDYLRESTRTAYTRVIELQKRGRTADTKALVQAYAEAKQEIELLEDQAVEFLANGEFDEDAIRSFLYDQRAIPGRGVLIRPPEALVDVLTERLACSACSEAGADCECDRECSQPKGSEVHGGGSQEPR